MVFVCKNDISPPILYAHMPVMAALSPSLLLVALPFGAEKRLSELLSVKRVACIGIKVQSDMYILGLLLIIFEIDSINIYIFDDI